MGILVTDTCVVTCAHVVAAALCKDFPEWRDRMRVRVCFPIFHPKTCVDAHLDKSKSSPPADDDVAILTLDRPAPSDVGIASLERFKCEEMYRLYGFPYDKERDRSHPLGGCGLKDGLRILSLAVGDSNSTT